MSMFNLKMTRARFFSERVSYEDGNPELVGTPYPMHDTEEEVSVFSDSSSDKSLPCSPLERGLHVLDSVEDFLKDLSKYCGVKIDDNLVKEVEGLVALYFTILGCKDSFAVSTAVFLYIRSHFKRSITREILDYVTNALTPLVAQSSSGPTWMSFLKEARYDWALCKGNKLFDHFSKLLGLMVTLGLCRASNVTFRLHDFKLCEPDMSVLHGSASDIVDAVFGTVSFFVEGLYTCFKQKSLKPLWTNNSITMELDDEYATLIGWWDLVMNGNLERVTRELGNEVKVVEFDKRLETLISKLRCMMDTMKGFEKKLVTDKYQKLLGIKNDYVTKRISSGVRKAPFAIELFGASSQGKTTFGDQLVDAILTSCGSPTSKEYRASHNPSDKFFSTWTTDKTVMLFDDVSNEKPAFVEKPPTRAIIDVCNNAPYYATKADLASKGKVFIEPLLVVVTTNVKNLDAYTYSNCPYSIQRRMDVVITVECKEEYQKVDTDGKPQGVDPSKVTEKNTINGVFTPPAFDDIWNLTVERAVQPDHLEDLATYAPVTWHRKGILMKDVPMKTVMQYVIDQYAIHEKNQEAIIDGMMARQGKIIKCPHEGCRQIQGFCDDHDNLPAVNEAHFGEEILQAGSTAKHIVENKIKSDFGAYTSMAEKAATMAILASATHFASRFDWMSIIPTSVARSRLFTGVMTFSKLKELKRKCITEVMIAILFYIVINWCNIWYFGLYHETIFLLLYTSIFLVCFLRHARDETLRMYRKFLLERNCISPVLQAARDRHVKSVCGACAVLGVLYAMAKVYKRYKAISPQGSLEPQNMEEVNRRDAEANPWTSVAPRDLPITPISKTVTTDVLRGVIEKNLVYATLVTETGRKLMANGLFLRSNVVIIPSHYFETENLEATFRKKNPESCGGKFAARLSKESSYLIPGTDLMMCFCTNGGSFRDLTKHFPLDHMPKVPFEMVYRKIDGHIELARGLAKPGEVQTQTSKEVYTFLGGSYENFTMDTFLGLCGAVLVSETSGSVIVGIHLGGCAGTRKGCYGSVTKDEIELGYLQLRKKEGVLLTGAAELFDVQVLGKETVQVNKAPHNKSSLFYMPHDSQIEYYGSCGGHVTSHSSVRVTPISEHITDVCNVPNLWGPPKMKPEWFGWQKCMENVSNPAFPYAHRLISIAIKDYKSSMEPLFTGIWSKTAPICDMDNVNGIPGQKFMDAIKSNTAIGYPLTGPKANYMVDLQPTARHPHKKTFTQEVWDHISRVEEKYRNGERAFEIAKAQKKDEVLSMDKEKCRIFYGNPVALTFLIRKYYLPIIRVLQMNPLVSECAVGINCHGPEWEDLHNHVLKHGTDRIFGGDYGKYDQKLPSQLIIASFRILIDFAKLCDYKQADLDIMEAMAGDVIYALIAYNGDLIGLTEGTHISGNSLTVDINGIAGSLNCRCFFYTLYPPDSFQDRVPFRDAVSLITYGDDNMGTVADGYQDFNIKAFSEFLAGYGQIYTMPSKDEELKKFLDMSQFEFLKRKSVYHKHLGLHLGALDEKSIFKSLHCYMREKKSPLTPDQACAINISTAVREWFNHGESKYNIRRSQMLDVARRSGIEHMCEGLELTYAERVQEWNQRYLHLEYTTPDPVIYDLE